MSLIRRQTVLRNNIKKIVSLKEAQEAAAEGHYGHVTQLDPDSVKRDFPATVYSDRNRISGRSSEILIFVGEDRALLSLTPENFIQYVELIFEMDEATNTLNVRGVPSEGWDDFSRLGALGFPGRDYSHRERVVVWSCGFKADEVKNKSQTSAGDAADRTKNYAHETEGRGKGVARTVVDKTKEAAGNVADTTKGVAHGAKENTEKVVDGAADAARSVGDRAKQKVVGKADEAQSRR